MPPTSPRSSPHHLPHRQLRPRRSPLYPACGSPMRTITALASPDSRAPTCTVLAWTPIPYPDTPNTSSAPGSQQSRAYSPLTRRLNTFFVYPLPPHVEGSGRALHVDGSRWVDLRWPTKGAMMQGTDRVAALDAATPTGMVGEQSAGEVRLPEAAERCTRSPDGRAVLKLLVERAFGRYMEYSGSRDRIHEQPRRESSTPESTDPSTA